MRDAHALRNDAGAALKVHVYRVYSKLMTHTALGPYSRAISRSMGPS